MSLDINKFSEDFWIFNFRSEVLGKDVQWTWNKAVRHQALNHETWIPKRTDAIFLDIDFYFAGKDMPNEDGKTFKAEFYEWLDQEIQTTKDSINKRARDKRALAKQEK